MRELIKPGDFVKVVRVITVKSDSKGRYEQEKMYLGKFAKVIRFREDSEKPLTRKVQIIIGYPHDKEGELLSFNRLELRKVIAGELAVEAL